MLITAPAFKRAIQHELQHPLTLKILSGNFHEGETIQVESKNGKLDFTAKSASLVT
jgi:ATP-dependent Clp protease ATP-binding subunit ClpA